MSADLDVTKKEHLLERLNKRNKERQNYLDVNREQRNKEQLQLEGADYFAQTFTERSQAIEAHIQKIRDSKKQASAHASGRGANKNNTSGDLAQQFAAITVEIQELQRYLTTSTLFLSDYKIKACQNSLNELNASCDDARLRLLPKKKFGFTSKKVTQKSVVNPKVAAANDDKTDSMTEKSKSSTGMSSTFTWTLANLVGKYIYLSEEEVNGHDITISRLKNCFVELQGHAGSVQISNVIDCTFLCGPISRSLFAEHCKRSTLVAACQQLRLHSSSSCRLHLHVTCRAIIEDCTKIDVSGYNYDYENIDNDFLAAGLDRSQNNFDDIADFNWLSPDMPSPNWRLVKDSPPVNFDDLRKTYKGANMPSGDL